MSSAFLALASALLLSPAPTETPTLVLRGGRVFDPVTGKIGEPGQLWISGERLLGERALDAALPDGTRVVDVAGCTLLPGLFDLHVHVWVPGGAMGARGATDPEDSLRSQLYCGVTHVVDLHSEPSLLAELRERSRGASDLARLAIAGAAFTAPGGHGTQFGFEANVVTTVAEVRARFEILEGHRPEVIKAIVEHGGWGGLPALPTLEEPLLAEIGRLAGEARIPLFCHVWTLDEAKTAVRAGARALVHGVFLGEVDAALAAAMLERAVAYVPTLAVVDGAHRVAAGTQLYGRELARGALAPAVFEAVSQEGSLGMIDAADLGGGERAHLSNLKTLFDAGVLVGTGTDAGNPLTPHGPALLRELELYVEAGLTPAQALTAATLSSARILGVEADFGSLAARKVADVVVVRGDPTRDISELWNVVEVIKSGTLVEREALARRHVPEAALSGARRAGHEVGATIDDFDDSDAESSWGGVWQVLVDTTAPGGRSEGEIAIADGALLIAGELREGVPWGAFAGASVYWSQGMSAAIDASAFSGLELRLRGAPRTYSLTVHRAAVKDYNVFAAMLPVTEEWSDVRVPFARLRQIGFGRPLEWSATDLTGLTIDARNIPGQRPVFGPFDIEVAWVRLYAD